MVMAGTVAIATVSTSAYLMTSYGDVTWSYVNNMASKMAAFAAQRLSRTASDVDLWNEFVMGHLKYTNVLL